MTLSSMAPLSLTSDTHAHRLPRRVSHIAIITHDRMTARENIFHASLDYYTSRPA